MSVCILGQETTWEVLVESTRAGPGLYKALTGSPCSESARCSVQLQGPLSSDHIRLSMDMRLFPCRGCREWCCSEQWGVCIFLEYAFLWIYAQEWDFWIIRVQVIPEKCKNLNDITSNITIIFSF